MDSFYVYVLIDPRNIEPIYVGRGKEGRMLEHWWHAVDSKIEYVKQNPTLKEKLITIADCGYQDVIYEIWFQSEDQDFIWWMESYVITFIGRGYLCNMTSGGERFGCDRAQWGLPSPDQVKALDAPYGLFIEGCKQRVREDKIRRQETRLKDEKRCLKVVPKPMQSPWTLSDPKSPKATDAPASSVVDAPKLPILADRKVKIRLKRPLPKDVLKRHPHWSKDSF